MLPSTLRSLCLCASLSLLGNAPAVLAQGNPDPKVMTFSLEVAEGGDLLSLTHGGDLGLARLPVGVALLKDEKTKKGLVLSTLLRNESGEVVGLATEIEYFPEGQRPGVNWQTHWTLVLPGVGSIYGYETEAIPEAHLPPFKQLSEGKPWKGEIRAKIASGPREDGYGVIVGGTGEFAGVTGKIAEYFVLKELRLDGAIIGTLQVEVTLD